VITFRSRKSLAMIGQSARLDSRAAVVVSSSQPLIVSRPPDSPTNSKKGKGSPYSITERRVEELIPVLGSQPAGDVSHKPGGRLLLLSGLQLPPQPLRGLLPISLLGEQRHNVREQFA